MERPRYLYRAASSRQRYPCWPIWYRERHPIKKHFRTLDCEDVYDSDDFYKIELNVRSDPAYTQFVSPSEYQRFQYQKRARLRAEAIVREIESYKQNAVWRKRLTRASREFEFVFEPYQQRLRQKYTWDWRHVFWEEQAKKAQQQARLKAVEDYRKQQKQQRSANGRFVEKSPPPFDPEKRIIGSIINNRVKNQEHADLAAEWYNNEAYIKHTLVWLQAMNAPFLFKVFCDLVDEQKTIQDQVVLCERLKQAMAGGSIQPIIETMRQFGKAAA